MKLSGVLTPDQLKQLAHHIVTAQAELSNFEWVAVLGDFTFTPNTDLTDRFDTYGTEEAQDRDDCDTVIHEDGPYAGGRDAEWLDSCARCRTHITEAQSFITDGYCRTCYDNTCHDCDEPMNECSCGGD